MVSVNGNHGIFSGTFIGNTDKSTTKPQPSEIKTVPMIQPEKAPETKELGDDLLTHGFYPDVSFTTKPLNDQTLAALNGDNGFIGTLNKLQGLTQTEQYNVSGCDPDKLARHMEQPLGENTAVGLNQLEELLLG